MCFRRFSEKPGNVIPVESPLIGAMTVPLRAPATGQS
jgi:hypothetical protein